MIRCKEVATLISTDALQALDVWQRLSVRLHVMMCRHCRRFARQVALVGRMAREIAHGYDAEVSPEFVERVTRTMADS